MMAQLYDVEVPTINYHLKKVFSDSEFEEEAVIRNFRITAADGKTYDTKHDNLSATVAVGYKVNSERAVQFRNAHRASASRRARGRIEPECELSYTRRMVWFRRRPPQVIEVGIGATRPLRREECERGVALVREVRTALQQKRTGEDLPDVDAFPLTEVRASRSRADCYQVRFRRQITYVPLGDARPSAFSIDWGPKGPLGSSTTEIARDHGAEPPVAGAAPQRAEAEALAFIDRSMREQGDFGVYGDVRDGLTNVHPNLTVEIFERPDSYWVTITPEDGHGHFLKFSVDRSTGALGQPLAGHLDGRGLDEGD